VLGCVLVLEPSGAALFRSTTLFRSAQRLQSYPLYARAPPVVALPEIFLFDSSRSQSVEFQANGPQRATQRSTLTIPGAEKGGKEDRKSTRLNSSHVKTSYAVFCSKT